MFEARYENERGLIRFSGGSGSIFRTLKIAGLGPPAKEFNVTGYAGQPGQTLISEKDLARTITLSGDVTVPDVIHQELSRMMRILYFPGKLTIASGNRKRSINCRCTTFDEPERHGRNIASLVLQFTCDHPYFTDEEPRTVNLFHRKDLIQSSFTLPCVFTERIHRQEVDNAGDFRAEPVITIYNEYQPAGISLLSLDYGVEIINHTTGQKILLERETVPGEVVIIDIPKRRITSNLAGDITASISQDTFLSDFWLETGRNDVESINYSLGENICVVMQYDNQYIEAVI